jgi:hypothetical protein
LHVVYSKHRCEACRLSSTPTSRRPPLRGNVRPDGFPKFPRFLVAIPALDGTIWRDTSVRLWTAQDQPDGLFRYGLARRLHEPIGHSPRPDDYRNTARAHVT